MIIQLSQLYPDEITINEGNKSQSYKCCHDNTKQEWCANQPLQAMYQEASIEFSLSIGMTVTVSESKHLSEKRYFPFH
jgi:hypothetical protein